MTPVFSFSRADKYHLEARPSLKMLIPRNTSIAEPREAKTVLGIKGKDSKREKIEKKVKTKRKTGKRKRDNKQKKMVLNCRVRTLI